MTHRYCEGEADCLSPEPTTHRVLVAECINEVLLTDATKAAGYVILDTACQRMCAGLHWSDAHVNKLKHWGLTTFQLPQQEFFEFGKGPTQQSDYALCFPASFGGQCCLLAPCVLSANIPCLASQSWMTDVGAVIDLAARHVTFTNLGVDVPLCMVNGHLAFDAIEFDMRREHRFLEKQPPPNQTVLQ